ncbi:MAG: lipoyl domain-containing protein, partial [Candidatus Dormibacteraceae bacterium]
MDVPLPRLADTLTEGTLARWLKAPGDEVGEGEPIAELETDKISSELAAPAAGVLTEVLVGEGETVEVGTVLARITSPSAGAAERTPV